MGTRQGGAEYQACRKDHPHACGDKIASTISPMFALGSSPRVWGQGTQTNASTDTVRIIPTRVGTSYILFCDTPRHEDHPHACGDKFKKSDELKNGEGSSPRVWGQDRAAQNIKPVGRIIPTRVGTRLLRQFLPCLP